MDSINLISEIKKVSYISSDLKEKFGLEYNPFPKSGIAYIGESEEITSKLLPAYHKTAEEIVTYMQDALVKAGDKKTPDYLSLIIRGEFGSGKTQTLMYIKYLFSAIKTDNFNPYVVYIDNPGSALSELIGAVMSQIGIENFRRYLWDGFMKYMSKAPSNTEKTRKEVFLTEVIKLRGINTTDLFSSAGVSVEDALHFSWDSTEISYKYLLEKLLSGTKSTQQKEISLLLKSYLEKCFMEEFKTAAVAEYFYEVVTDSLNVSQAWDHMVTGDIKNLSKREFYILHAIVRIAKEYLGATDFIILVDEFEELASGRISDKDMDNYLRNLRSLIDNEKNWCSVFAMNTIALKKIEKLVPPLLDRIGDRIIDLNPLNLEASKEVIVNYLSLARRKDFDKGALYPFTEDAIKAILNTRDISLQGSPRFIMKCCFRLLQSAAKDLKMGDIIDEMYVKKIIGEQLN